MISPRHNFDVPRLLEHIKEIGGSVIGCKLDVIFLHHTKKDQKAGHQGNPCDRASSFKHFVLALGWNADYGRITEGETIIEVRIP